MNNIHKVFPSFFNHPLLINTFCEELTISYRGYAFVLGKRYVYLGPYNGRDNFHEKFKIKPFEEEEGEYVL